MVNTGNFRTAFDAEGKSCKYNLREHTQLHFDPPCQKDSRQEETKAG
ncbi:hypothetical protein T11_7044 [Trichinella zimbabwensis]|uniref:Uncharacterized protein n=1 Tax=Trichinella zimbabwensis TaxID=268475 RepID=A0A0V1F2P8_9BILA|nr:hypothetical protein T11_7044 [Trichinella zimbabwensis]